MSLFNLTYEKAEGPLWSLDKGELEKYQLPLHPPKLNPPFESLMGPSY